MNIDIISEFLQILLFNYKFWRVDTYIAVVNAH